MIDPEATVTGRLDCSGQLLAAPSGLAESVIATSAFEVIADKN
jgi:hypothetical protein